MLRLLTYQMVKFPMGFIFYCFPLSYKLCNNLAVDIKFDTFMCV